MLLYSKLHRMHKRALLSTNIFINIARINVQIAKKAFQSLKTKFVEDAMKNAQLAKQIIILIVCLAQMTV